MWRLLTDVAAATALPVLAVGGVTADRVHQLAGTGSAGFAAIGFFAGDDGEHLPAMIAAASQAFEKG